MVPGPPLKIKKIGHKVNLNVGSPPISMVWEEPWEHPAGEGIAASRFFSSQALDRVDNGETSQKSAAGLFPSQEGGVLKIVNYLRARSQGI